MKSSNSQARFRLGYWLNVGFFIAALLVTASSSKGVTFFPSLFTANSFSDLSLGQYPNALPGDSGLQISVNGASQAAVDFYSFGESASAASSYGFKLLTSNPAFNHAITGTTVISISGSGQYILKLASIDLSGGSVLTINASASARVVFDIAGSFVVDNSQIVLTGGLQSKNVVFNLTNPSKTTAPVSLGKVNNGIVQGAILAKSRDVVLLGNSTVKEQVIARTVSVNGGTAGLGTILSSFSKASAFPILSLSQPATALTNTPDLQNAVNGANDAAVAFYSLGESSSTASSNGFTLLTSNPAFNQAITGTTNISIAGNGKYVMKLASVDLEGGSLLTITGSAGARVVFDIAGTFIVDHSQIVLAGGILSKNVVFNLTNPSKSDGPLSLGRVTAANVAGSILAKSRDVAVLGNSTVKGQVIARTVSIEGGAVVSPEF